MNLIAKRCNTHAGQGFDYHYHGDPFGPNCLYSSADYNSTTSHPPIFGYSLGEFKWQFEQEIVYTLHCCLF